MTPPTLTSWSLTTDRQFDHDCDQCLFLGTYRPEDSAHEVVDLYVHYSSTGRVGLLYRTSDEGADYVSTDRDGAELFARAAVPAASIWQQLLMRELLARQLAALFAREEATT